MTTSSRNPSQEELDIAHGRARGEHEEARARSAGWCGGRSVRWGARRLRRRCACSGRAFAGRGRSGVGLKLLAMAQNTQRRSAMAGKGWYLVALLLFAQCVQANPYGDEDEDDDEDEELLVVGDANEGGSDERLESLHDAVGDAAPPPTPTSEIEDPLKNVIDAALNQPAIFAQRLKVNFGPSNSSRPQPQQQALQPRRNNHLWLLTGAVLTADDGKVEEILLKRGDSPMQVVEEFAEEHGVHQPLNLSSEHSHRLSVLFSAVCEQAWRTTKQN